MLNLTGGTFPPNYKLSPMTFNLGTSAAGKTGVVPLVLAGTSQPSTISFVRLQPPKPTTVTAGTSNPAAAVAEAARKRARLDLPSVSTGNGSGSSASNLLALKRRRRTTEDGVKGLRYFATKVCDKVKERNVGVNVWQFLCLTLFSNLEHRPSTGNHPTAFVAHIHLTHPQSVLSVIHNH